MTLTRRLGLGRLATCTTFGSFPPPAVASNSVVSYKACALLRPSSALRSQRSCLAFRSAGPRCLRAHIGSSAPLPIVSGLVASEKGDKFAWVENVRGVRNIWSAGAADSQPRQLTHYTADDGQELTQLTFSADGSELLYVRGGDHDENWPAQGNLAPNPDNSPSEAKVTIWSVSAHRLCRARRCR